MATDLRGLNTDEKDESGLKFEAITKEIIGAAFEVYRVLGYGFLSQDEPQLLNELKATGHEAGLLINFGRVKVEFKRMVFTDSSA